MDRTKPMRYEILIPAGNPTALVWDENFNLLEKQNINDEILAKHNFVEQVGFIKPSKFKLSMAGGEVCVNALRSAAFCFMDELNLDFVDINMNGEIYSCGRDENGIFVKAKFSKEFEISHLDDLNTLVNLGDITHIVNFKNLEFNNGDEYKNFAFLELKRRNLLDLKASGFVNCTCKNDQILIKPVVFVRDIKTLFYESACGSGSIATALSLNLRGYFLDKYTITQPSGKNLVVEIFKNAQEFLGFKISGDVKNVRKTF